MNYRQLIDLFNKIEGLINEGKLDEASDELNVAGEAVLKAEQSLDKVRDKIDDKQNELAIMRQKRQTISSSAWMSQRRLNRTLSAYRDKMDKLLVERKLLFKRLKTIEAEIELFKQGLGGDESDNDTDGEYDPKPPVLSNRMRDMIERSIY
jgi:chromosome segregation ATPase